MWLSKRTLIVLSVLGVVAVVFVLWSVVRIMDEAGGVPMDEAECILDPACVWVGGEPVYPAEPTVPVEPGEPTVGPTPEPTLPPPTLSPDPRDCPPGHGCINPPPYPTE